MFRPRLLAGLAGLGPRRGTGLLLGVAERLTRLLSGAGDPALLRAPLSPPGPVPLVAPGRSPARGYPGSLGELTYSSLARAEDLSGTSAFPSRLG